MTTLTFPRRRARARVYQIAGALAEAVGDAIRWTWRRRALVPGLAGAGMVSYGFALWHLWTGIAIGGVFLLAMDRQIKLGPPRQE